MAVNKAIVIGNLGADPQVHALPSGQSVANLSLATTERFTDRNGGKQQRTEWHRIVAFGKLAETCAEYLSKGRQVYVEGGKCCNFENGDGGRPERNWAAKSQAGRSNSWSMN
jgi:single-strand DNA-binding protein